ncbi:MAG: hypothetical protein MJ252_24645, partial [archaeon]|nr:hypothetical protein [archaeon]
MSKLIKEYYKTPPIYSTINLNNYSINHFNQPASKSNYYGKKNKVSSSNGFPSDSSNNCINTYELCELNEGIGYNERYSMNKGIQRPTNLNGNGTKSLQSLKTSSTMTSIKGNGPGRIVQCHSLNNILTANNYNYYDQMRNQLYVSPQPYHMEIEEPDSLRRPTKYHKSTQTLEPENKINNYYMQMRNISGNKMGNNIIHSESCHAIRKNNTQHLSNNPSNITTGDTTPYNYIKDKKRILKEYVPTDSEENQELSEEYYMGYPIKPSQAKKVFSPFSTIENKDTNTGTNTINYNQDTQSALLDKYLDEQTEGNKNRKSQPNNYMSIQDQNYSTQGSYQPIIGEKEKKQRKNYKYNFDYRKTSTDEIPRHKEEIPQNYHQSRKNPKRENKEIIHMIPANEENLWEESEKEDYRPLRQKKENYPKERQEEKRNQSKKKRNFKSPTKYTKKEINKIILIQEYIRGYLMRKRASLVINEIRKSIAYSHLIKLLFEYYSFCKKNTKRRIMRGISSLIDFKIYVNKKAKAYEESKKSQKKIKKKPENKTPITYELGNEYSEDKQSKNKGIKNQNNNSELRKERKQNKPKIEKEKKEEEMDYEYLAYKRNKELLNEEEKKNYKVKPQSALH